jgi:hypothetical protein
MRWNLGHFLGSAGALLAIGHSAANFVCEFLALSRMVNRVESSNVQNFIPSRSLSKKGITRFLTSLFVYKIPLVQNLMAIWRSMVTPLEEIRFTVNATQPGILVTSNTC